MEEGLKEEHPMGLRKECLGLAFFWDIGNAR